MLRGAKGRPRARAFAPALSLSLACATFACESRRTSADGTGPGEGPIHVTGRLFDAETGKPVSRARIWVHGVNDEPGDTNHVRPAIQQRSLAPSDETTFEFNLVEPTLRLRVAGMDDVYELFQQNFTAQDGRLDLDVRLVPKHWVRLHGQVYSRGNGKLKPYHPPGHYIWSLGVTPVIDLGPGHGFRIDEDGTYSMRAPRELFKVLTIDCPYHVTPREVDLRDEHGEDHVQDFVFEE